MKREENAKENEEKVKENEEKGNCFTFSKIGNNFLKNSGRVVRSISGIIGSTLAKMVYK
jgi:hypothetical protein